MKHFSSMIFLFCMLCNFAMEAQDNNSRSPIIFIYDASGSMWGEMGSSTKMQIAAEVLGKAVDGLSDDQPIGLVAYGHRTKGDCEDVEFLVNVGSGTKAAVNKAVAGIKPLGKTPLAYSALQVIDHLKTSGTKATMILITDGIESCGGNICDVIKAAKAEGIDFRLHIIGFGLKGEDTGQLVCAAEAGDGKYFNAEDAADLGDVLTEATTTTVDDPDGNVSVFALKNGIPIDAWFRAQDVAGKNKPISVRTYQDTAMMYLPPGKYNLSAVPLQGSDVDQITIENFESYEDKITHQTISFDGGKLGVTTTNNGENWDCIVKLMDQSGKVAASVRTYSAPKEVEVNPGTYDVSIQALGSMEGLHTNTVMKGISITGGDVTPLSYNFETGTFKITTKIGSEHIDCIVNIKEQASGTSVGGARTYTKGAEFLLNPGSYEVKATPLGVHKSKAAQIITIKLEAGSSMTKELSF